MDNDPISNPGREELEESYEYTQFCQEPGDNELFWDWQTHKPMEED